MQQLLTDFYQQIPNNVELKLSILKLIQKNSHQTTMKVNEILI